MRFYRLVVKNVPSYTIALTDPTKRGLKTENGTFEISSLQKDGSPDPTPLQIEFTIQAFNSALDSVPAVIKFYNITKTFVESLNILALNKCPFTFEAGWNDNQILSKALNYTKLHSQIILTGRIQSAIGDWSDRQNYAVITTAIEKPKKELLEELQKSYGTQSKDKFKVQVKEGDKYETFLTEALKLVCDDKVKIVFSDGVKELVWKGKQGTILEFSNTQELTDLVSCDAQSNGLETPINLGLDPTLNSILVSKLNDVGDAATTFKKNEVIEINPSDCIAQPEYLGYSNILSVITRLRPDIHLNSRVHLKNIAGLSSDLTSGVFDLNGISDLSLAIEGEYMVSNIIHQGNFYGSDPSSWSTQMQLIPPKGAKTNV